MLALLAGAHAAARADKRSATIAAALVALATLTRYVGASTGVAAGMAVLLIGSGRRRRAVTAALVAVSGIAAILGWDLLSDGLWGGGAPKAVAWHPGNAEPHLAVDVASAWFHLPAAWPWAA